MSFYRINPVIFAIILYYYCTWFTPTKHNTIINFILFLCLVHIYKTAAGSKWRKHSKITQKYKEKCIIKFSTTHAYFAFILHFLHTWEPGIKEDRSHRVLACVQKKFWYCVFQRKEKYFISDGKKLHVNGFYTVATPVKKWYLPLKFVQVSLWLSLHHSVVCLSLNPPLFYNKQFKFTKKNILIKKVVIK